MKKLVVTLAIALSAAGLSAAVAPAYAVDCVKDPTATGCPCQVNPSASVCDDLTNTDPDAGLSGVFKNVINMMLYVAGVIAVVMIIVSSIRMVNSRGESDNVAKARHTLMYAVIGLVVAASAFAVVNFVLGKL